MAPVRGKKSSIKDAKGSQRSTKVEDVTKAFKETQKPGQNLRKQLQHLQHAPECGAKLHAEAKACLFYAAEKVGRNVAGAVDLAMQHGFDTLAEGMSKHNSLPCGLLLAQLVLAFGEKAPAQLWTRLLFNQESKWVDPCDDIADYSEADRTYGDQVKGDTAEERIRNGARLFKEKVKKVQERQGKVIDYRAWKEYCRPKNMGPVLVEAICSQPDLMPGRKARIEKIRLSTAATQVESSDGNGHQVRDRGSTRERTKEKDRPSNGKAEKEAKPAEEKLAKIKELVETKLSSAPLEHAQRWEAANQLLQVSTDSLREHLGEEEAEEACAMLERLNQRSDAMKAALNAGSPIPEPVYYNAASKELIRRLCSQGDSPKNDIETVMELAGPQSCWQWSGEIPDPYAEGLDFWGDQDAMLITLASESVAGKDLEGGTQLHPIADAGTLLASVLGKNGHTGALSLYPLLKNADEVDATSWWLAQCRHDDDQLGFTRATEAIHEDLWQAVWSPYCELKCMRGHCIIAADRLVRQYYTSSLPKAEKLQLCTDLAPLHQAFNCSDLKHKPDPEACEDGAIHVWDDDDNDDPQRQAQLSANRWGVSFGNSICKADLKVPLSEHENNEFTHEELRRHELAFILDALHLLQREHQLSRLSMHMICCYVKYRTEDMVSQGKDIFDTSGREVEAKLSELTWEHMAALSDHDLSLLNSLISILVSSRFPGMTKFSQQIHDMLTGGRDTYMSIDGGHVGFRPDAFEGSVCLRPPTSAEAGLMQASEARPAAYSQAGMDDVEALEKGSHMDEPTAAANGFSGPASGRAEAEQVQPLSVQECEEQLPAYVEEMLQNLYDTVDISSPTENAAELAELGIRDEFQKIACICNKAIIDGTSRDCLNMVLLEMSKIHRAVEDLPFEMTEETLHEGGFKQQATSILEQCRGVEALHVKLAEELMRYGGDEDLTFVQSVRWLLDWRDLTEAEAHAHRNAPIAPHSYRICQERRFGLVRAYPHFRQGLLDYIAERLTWLVRPALQVEIEMQAALQQICEWKGKQEALTQTSRDNKLMKAVAVLVLNKLEGLLAATEEVAREKLQRELLEDEELLAKAAYSKVKKKKKKQQQLQAPKHEQMVAEEQVADEEDQEANDIPAAEEPERLSQSEQGREAELKRKAEEFRAFNSMLDQTKAREEEAEWQEVPKTKGWKGRSGTPVHPSITEAAPESVISEASAHTRHDEDIDKASVDLGAAESNIRSSSMRTDEKKQHNPTGPAQPSETMIEEGWQMVCPAETSLKLEEVRESARDKTQAQSSSWDNEQMEEERLQQLEWEHASQPYARDDSWERAAAKENVETQPPARPSVSGPNPVDDRRGDRVVLMDRPIPLVDRPSDSRLQSALHSLPRGCLTCGELRHSFKQCAKWRRMSCAEQKKLLEKYGLTAKVLQPICYLCRESHAFADCPQIPKRITRDEKFDLFHACKSHQTKLGQDILNKVYDRYGGPGRRDEPWDARQSQRQPSSERISETATAPPASWAAVANAEMSIPPPISWAAVANADKQRAAGNQPTQQGQPKRPLPPPSSQRQGLVASAHAQHIEMAFLMEEVHLPEMAGTAAGQPVGPWERDLWEAAASQFPPLPTERPNNFAELLPELQGKAARLVTQPHPADDRCPQQAWPPEAELRLRTSWHAQQQEQQAAATLPTPLGSLQTAPPGFAPATGYPPPPPDARTSSRPSTSPVWPPGFPQPAPPPKPHPPVLGPLKLPPMPVVSGGGLPMPSPMGAVKLDDENSVDEIMGLLGVDLSPASEPRVVPKNAAESVYDYWDDSGSFPELQKAPPLTYAHMAASPAEMPEEDDSNDEDFHKAIQASLAETRMLAAQRPAVSSEPAQQLQLSEIATPGLQNNTGEYNCFLNCIIQCLWHCSEFCHHVQSWDSAQVQENAVVTALVELFRSFAAEEAQHAAAREPGERRRQVVTPVALRQALHNWSEDHFRMGEMSDAAEVLSAIYDSLALVADGGSLIDRLFQWQIHQYVECRLCHRRTHDTQHSQFFFHTFATALRMEVAADLEHKERGVASLGSLLGRVETQALKSCDIDKGGCGRMNSVKHGLQLHTMPARVFTLQLGWEREQESSEDIMDTMATIAEDVDVAEVFCGSSKPYVYMLRSMVCYYGLHYHAFVKDRASGVWRMFDDTVTSEVGSWASVQQKCHVGKIQPSILFYEATWKPRSGPPRC